MSQKLTKRKDKKEGIWRPFLILIKDAKLPYFFILLMTLVSLFQSQLYLMFPQATQQVLAGDISSGAIMTMVVILFGQALVTALTQFIGTVTRTKITFNFRKFMVRKTLRLPVPYYDKNMADRLISRTTEDTTKLSDFFGNGLPMIPARVYQTAGVFVILFSYDWRLVALELVMIPLIFLVGLLAGKLEYKWNNRIQGKLAELTGYLAEALANIPLIRVFVQEKKEKQKGVNTIDELYRTKLKYAGVQTTIQFLSESVSVIQTILCVVGGVYLVSHEIITLDIWIAFYLYTSGLVSSLSTFIVLWQWAKTAQGAAGRMAQVAVEADEDMGGELTMADCDGDIKFEHVTFSYSEDEVLKDISFSIPKNRVTALVGKSGAGKSTVYGLIERFYRPDSGTITVGGQDVAKFDLASWRRNIGYVPQEAMLFSGTIRDNITYGLDRQADEAEIIQAAKDANAYDFIMEFEAGFETQVGERGMKLSGGQRQRIAIARALLKNPRILLLDEATSSLDVEAAYEVNQALERLKAGRTTILITHDLSLVQDAESIVLLDNGTVAGTGTHAELKTKSSLYRELLELQQAAAVHKV